MNLVVASAFRNAAGVQVTRWITQVAALHIRAHMDGHTTRAIAVEGDSTDSTRRQLLDGAIRAGLDLDLRTCNLGGPHHGSTEDPARLCGLSKVLNEAMDGVRDTDDYMFYVESDLIWSSRTVMALLDTLAATPAIDVVSPLVFAGPNFYDVWGFRKDGARFGPFPPYHHALAPAPALTLVDSVGSALLARAEVARSVRTVSNALVEWCDRARARDYAIAVDPAQRIEHPV